MNRVNAPKLHTVCHYTSITLLMHELNWWYNTCPVCWVYMMHTGLKREISQHCQSRIKLENQKKMVLINISQVNLVLISVPSISLCFIHVLAEVVNVQQVIAAASSSQGIQGTELCLKVTKTFIAM